MLTRTTCFLVATLAGIACAPPWGPPPNPSELLAADRAFAAETAARGADGWAAWFADDGRMYRERGYVDGRDAIRETMVPTFADSLRALRWAPDTAIVAASGDIGYTLGHWETVLTTAAGDSVVGWGNYVTIWRRQSDGTWKATVDIGNQAERPE
ncbi:MAG TPA: nuclear transport factor 2 family protein [Gemmatimonadales bacterium]|jgi:ketosteroid isomerase-like protein